MTTAIKSISISLDMLAHAEKYKISLSEAVRVGLAVILCDYGEEQFINKLNINRKIENMARIITDLSKKVEEYEKNVLAKTG